MHPSNNIADKFRKQKEVEMQEVTINKVQLYWIFNSLLSELIDKK